MKKFMEMIRTLLIGIALGAVMIGLFLGATLQESYKLTPVTEEEIQDAANAY